MRGLMMDFPLSIPAIVRRAGTLFGSKTIATRLPDRSIARSTYGEMLDRVHRLAAALVKLGVKPGERVATLAWASQSHLEAYLAIPLLGGILHTLNLRLHPEDLIYIINDARDRVVLVDESLLPLWERVRPHVTVEHVVVMSRVGQVGQVGEVLDYEALIASSDPTSLILPGIEEHEAAAMCYTSGTTGRPKGILYSHRAIVLHSFAQGLTDVLGIGEHDTLLPIVPMFHVNAWGLPFTGVLFGSNQVFPGPFLDAPSVLDLMVSERVTVTAGVPTVWLGLLQELDKAPGTHDLTALRTIAVGGAAAPESMIRGYQERHGIQITHAWGMTELTPVGTMGHLPASMRDASADEQYRCRAKQGRPLPFVEIRARSDEGFAPWDGATMGELEVRGPWVASAYYNTTGPDSRFTDDGWFRTGDIVTIDANGCVEIADRSKDLVKSGGEWISSVALENALMGHPAVAEAAVVAVPHAKWDERPLAAVVLKAGKMATCADLLKFLEPKFAKWWLPDAIEFVPELPRTSVGKIKKSLLRDQFKDRYRAQ